MIIIDSHYSHNIRVTSSLIQLETSNGFGTEIAA